MSLNTYVIAEMAWSHAGSLDRAIQILEGAAQAGADAISVHITDMDSYMTKGYRCVDGKTLSDSASDEVSIFDFLNSINISPEQWRIFSKRAKELGIDLVVMCNDIKSFALSQSLEVSSYALSAASFLEFDLIKKITSHCPSILLRTGGATLEEIERVLKIISGVNPDAQICLLAGIQLYPTPIEEMNLASIKALVDKFSQPGISYGLADHIDGDQPCAITVPSLALAFGATVLEKHITTDRTEKLEDYEAALGIKQFTEFVQYVRLVEKALGSGDPDYMNDNPGYQKYRLVSRKKVVANVAIPEGAVLTREMLAFKRSDEGAQLDSIDAMIGKRLLMSKNIDDGISLDDLILEAP